VFLLLMSSYLDPLSFPTRRSSDLNKVVIPATTPKRITLNLSCIYISSPSSFVHCVINKRNIPKRETLPMILDTFNNSFDVSKTSNCIKIKNNKTGRKIVVKLIHNLLFGISDFFAFMFCIFYWNKDKLIFQKDKFILLY